MTQARNLPTRRAILAGATALPIAALPTIAFAASGGDAKLIDLCRQGLDARRAIADAEALSAAARRSYEAARPNMPDTLRITAIDRGYWDNLGNPEGFPNAGYFTAGDVHGIRDHDRKNLTTVRSYPPDHPLEFQPIPEGEPTGEFCVDHVLVIRRNGEWSQEKGARADEIVAEWDMWNSADIAESLRYGIEASEDAMATAWDTRDEIASAIAEHPAATIAGLKAKAAVIISEKHAGGDSDKAIMASLIADLLAFGGGTGLKGEPFLGLFVSEKSQA